VFLTSQGLISTTESRSKPPNNLHFWFCFSKYYLLQDISWVTSESRRERQEFVNGEQKDPALEMGQEQQSPQEQGARAPPLTLPWDGMVAVRHREMTSQGTFGLWPKLSQLSQAGVHNRSHDTYLQKPNNGQVPVAHTCNPNLLGGGDQDVGGLRLAQAGCLGGSISANTWVWWYVPVTSATAGSLNRWKKSQVGLKSKTLSPK
jgi:hypothetical protein